MTSMIEEAALREENAALRAEIEVLREQNARQWHLLSDPDGLAQRAIKLWNGRAVSDDRPHR